MNSFFLVYGHMFYASCKETLFRVVDILLDFFEIF
jgi:hypothetical protein